MGPFHTNRLILRRFRIEDLDDIYREVYSDPDVSRYYRRGVESLEQTRKRIQRIVDEGWDDGCGRLAVERKSTKKVIGQVHLDRYENSFYRIPEEEIGPPYRGEVELAFAFGKAHWGKGLAYEACIPMIDYAFNQLQLQRLVGGAFLKNERSMRLQKQLGYRVVRNTHQGGGWVTILENPKGTVDLN